MSTDAQNQANRANAQLSTGPRTEEGKASSCHNALKHGLTAQTILLPGEEPQEYEKLYAGMRGDFNPLNTTENALTRELVDLQWRLLRIARLEASILSADIPDIKYLNCISLHAARMKRQYSATLKEYQAMHAVNHQDVQAQLKQAEIVHQADVILERESTLGQYGFDFTTQYFETWLRRKQALKDADDTVIDYQNDELCPDLDDEEIDDDLAA